MVGLEWLNKEESVVATGKVEEGPQGPQPQGTGTGKPPLPGTALLHSQV